MALIKKPSAETLREAARMVAEGEEQYSCYAAARATGIPVHRIEVYDPGSLHYVEKLGVIVLWVGDMGVASDEYPGLPAVSQRDHRVIALLFAALVAEDEENES